MLDLRSKLLSSFFNQLMERTPHKHLKHPRTYPADEENCCIILSKVSLPG